MSDNHQNTSDLKGDGLMQRVIVVGAGGSVGRRIANNLADSADYELLCVEQNAKVRAELEDDGKVVVAFKSAAPTADTVILALPDSVIGTFVDEQFDHIDAGTLVITLDPAAAYAERLPKLNEVAHVVVHPCHPPLFDSDNSQADRKDWFGGSAPQDVVCALDQGDDTECGRAEALARNMFQPVRDVYWLSVEQMAILEPALVELGTQTLIQAMKDLLDHAIDMGVPSDAARAFLLGHIRTQLAVVFGFAGFNFSAGAIRNGETAKNVIFQSDWTERIFDLQFIKRTTEQITEPTRS